MKVTQYSILSNKKVKLFLSQIYLKMLPIKCTINCITINYY